MYLVSTRSKRVFLRQPEREFAFSAGETIHTENSYKYSPEEIENLRKQGAVPSAEAPKAAAGGIR